MGRAKSVKVTAQDFITGNITGGTLNQGY